jgi:tyrosine-protein kinase Etk/Wzc
MSSTTNKTTSKDADEIDLGRLIGEFIDHRKLIISVTSLYISRINLCYFCHANISG